MLERKDINIIYRLEMMEQEQNQELERNQEQEINRSLDGGKPPARPLNAIERANQQTIRDIYSKSQITRTIQLSFSCIGKRTHETIEKVIVDMVENKCIHEGYVRPNSVHIKTYSSGLIDGKNVRFEVIFECDIFFPVAGSLLSCVARTVNKAGIMGESESLQPTPFKLHIMRDHSNMNTYFQSIGVGDKFVARVIQTKFEINDKFISIVAELVRP